MELLHHAVCGKGVVATKLPINLFIVIERFRTIILVITNSETVGNLNLQHSKAAPKNRRN